MIFSSIINHDDRIISAERKRREREVFFSQGVDAVPSDVVLWVVHPCTVVDVRHRKKRLLLLGVVTVSVVSDGSCVVVPFEPERIEVVPFDHLSVSRYNDPHGTQMVRDVIPGFDTAGSSEKPSAVEGRAFELKRPVLLAIYQRTEIVEAIPVGICSREFCAICKIGIICQSATILLDFFDQIQTIIRDVEIVRPFSIKFRRLYEMSRLFAPSWIMFPLSS